MAAAFAKSTPADQVLPHRHAWATGEQTTFEVISRDGKRRYEVVLSASGDLRCSCPARGHCWHQEKVAARILREGVPESVAAEEEVSVWHRVNPERYAPDGSLREPMKRLAPEPGEVPF